MVRLLSHLALRLFRQYTTIMARVVVCGVATVQIAQAKEVAVSFSGVITSGVKDFLGIFGPVGGNLIGRPITASIVYDSSQFIYNSPDCAGSSGNDSYCNVTSGTLTTYVTVNGITLQQSNVWNSSIPSYTFIYFQTPPYTTVNVSNCTQALTSELFNCSEGAGSFNYSPPISPTINNIGSPGRNSSFQFTYSIQNTNSYVDTLGAFVGGLTIVNPFLLGTKNFGNLDLPALLPNLKTPASATALAADGVSAAIVLEQVSTQDPVTFTVSSGNSAVTLLQYDPYFLTKGPLPGNSSLSVIPTLIGGVYYAVALLQSPSAIVTPDYTTPIVVTAQQQGQASDQASIPLVPPPVVLVHGLWGDQTSLGSLETYLQSHAPWNYSADLVQTLCYSKYLAFDATSDPIANGDVCEHTSSEVLGSTITTTLNKLNQEGIVVGRVDAAVHSMGGLAARNYASQPSYRSRQNRGEGQFHNIVTLDTPEIGSELASFLIKNSTADLQRGRNAAWIALCGVSTGPIETCFAAQGLPISDSRVPVNGSALDSLIPTGQSLTNPKLSPPNIRDAIWHSIRATAPANSALKDFLNSIIKEITPVNQSVQTIFSILGTGNNDAIVTTKSQSVGTHSGQSVALSGQSHSSLASNAVLGKLISKLDWNDSSVVNDPSGVVNTAVACLLQSVGAALCPSAYAEVPPITNPSSAASVDNLKTFSIVVTAPNDAHLGVPFDVVIRIDHGVSLKNIDVGVRQANGENRSCSISGVKFRREGDVVYVPVNPCVLGKSVVSIIADLNDGSLDIGETPVTIQPPATPPSSFKPGSFETLDIDLDSNNPAAWTDPTATFQGIPGTFAIPTEFLSFNLVPGSPESVLSITKTGLMRGLEEGTAMVEVHFGVAVGRLEVNVHHRYQ